ncbi:DMT family transporter [Rhodocista pekingensis]|uniref:DMT family transporter n=1 Tax=Rhodocista pekingensis TaxID=201185 RepID=A0ABW2KUA8_9PROT
MHAPTAQAPTPQTMRAADWGLLCFQSVLWGGSFLWMGLAIRELPPFTIVACRVTLAAGALYLAARALGQAMPCDGRSWRDFFIMAAVNNLVPFSLIAWSQSQITVGLASILNATTPLFTVVLMALLGGAGRPGPLKLTGLVAGFIGVAVLLGPKALTGADMALLGCVAVLTASFCYGLAGVWSRRFAGQPPIVSSTGVLAAAAVLTVPLSLAVDRPWTLAPSWVTVGAVAMLGLFSTGLAYLIYYRILRTAGPSNASLVTFLVPVSAILMGAVVMGERLGPNAFAGMGLIFLGLAAIDGRPLAWASARLTGRRGGPVPGA